MSKVIPLLETLFLNRGGQPELWKAIIKVINSKPEEAKFFATYSKSKLKDLKQETQLLSLDLIDFVVAEGKIPVWTQIASKDFLTSLIGILKTRDAPEVQLKILYLIKKWGTRFESYKEILPNFSEFYKSLKSTGAIIFPEDYQPEYIKYIGDYQAADLIENKNRSPIIEKKSREMPINNYNDDFSGNDSSNAKKEKKNSAKEKNSYSPDNYKYSDKDTNLSNKSYKIDLNQDNYDKKYSKLIGKLSIWFENIILANDMIDNTKLGTSIDDGLRYVMENLREAEKELVTYIQEKVRNEKVLELCLGVNDDVNKTISRYDVIRSKSKPEPFVSNFEYKVENYSNKSSSTTEHKKSRSHKNRHGDRGRSASKSPDRVIEKKSNKQYDDPFEVFDMKNEVSNISGGNKNKPSNNSSTGNVKSVDDIFEIFGGNMNINSNLNNTNEINIADNNNNNNNKNSVQNFDFDTFSNQQGNNVDEPIFNIVSGGNPNQTFNFNPNTDENNFKNFQSNSIKNDSNTKPGIDSLAEKLKNLYTNKDDDNSISTNNMMNNKIGISPNMNNMGVGMNNMFNYPGQHQPQFNMMPGYNMVHPGMMGVNMQSQHINMMNMGLNPMNPMGNPNPVNSMNMYQNRFNPGFDQNFQMPSTNGNNLNNNLNNNPQNDPFNFGGK